MLITRQSIILFRGVTIFVFFKIFDYFLLPPTLVQTRVTFLRTYLFRFFFNMLRPAVSCNFRVIYYLSGD